MSLELSQPRAQAGAEIHAILEIRNVTGKPINTTCGFVFAAGLTDSHIPFDAAFTLECRMHQSIPAGLTRYPITIITTYGSCSQSGRPDGARPGCLPGPMGAGSNYTTPPPLPKGTYSTAVRLNGFPAQGVRIAGPTTVTLT